MLDCLVPKLPKYTNCEKCFTFRTESIAGKITAARERQTHKVSH